MVKGGGEAWKEVVGNGMARPFSTARTCNEGLGIAGKNGMETLTVKIVGIVLLRRR